MNSQEIIKQRALYPVDFHDAFSRAFGTTPEEMDFSPMPADFSKQKIDATYLAKLILNGDRELWMMVANHQRPLDSDNERLKELYKDLCEYFVNRDFTIENFSEEAREFQGIIDYLVAKFSRASLTQEKTHRQTHEILASHQ
ncbi:MAG: hypothetical protein ACTTH6_01515 [Candidatus Altimarinota bacterium]